MRDEAQYARLGVLVSYLGFWWIACVLMCCMDDKKSGLVLGGRLVNMQGLIGEETGRLEGLRRRVEGVVCV